jgi:hypothetical protein
MMLARSAALCGLALVLNAAVFGSFGARAQTSPHVSAPNAISAPGTKTVGIPSAHVYAPALFVLNAKGAELSGRTLTLSGVAPTAILFASHPSRQTGYADLAALLNLWARGGSFAKVPPNATISAFRRDGSDVSDAVVVLKTARLSAGKLTFTVDRLEGDLAGADGKLADGPASLFIDTIWFGAGGGDGVHYLGTSPTTGGTSPNVGARQNYGDGRWPNPSPNYREPPPQRYDPSGLNVPPELRTR